MRSFLTTWFLNLKLDVTLEEAVRLKPPVLDLRSHGLEEIPNLLIKLPSEYLLTLKCLLLQYNALGYFPRISCHYLKNLKGLTLDYNKLVDLPFDFRHMKNLAILNVSHNSFESLRFFHVVCQLKSLRIFWANATGIDEIPIEIGQLTKLRVLGLRSNRISRLPTELLSLRFLRWLTLANNRISELPPEIIQLTSLVHLNLKRNFLQSLPDNFNRLLELQYLYLDYNMLTIDQHFKDFIASLPNLKYCSVSGNSENNPNDDTSTSNFIQEIERIGITAANDSANTVRSIVSSTTPQSNLQREVSNVPFEITDHTPEYDTNQGQESVASLQNEDNDNNDDLGNLRLSHVDSMAKVYQESLREYVYESSECGSLFGSENELFQSTDDDSQAGDTVFTWDIKESNLVNNNEDQQPGRDMTQGQDFQLPFDNSSVTSVIEVSRSRKASTRNFSHDDHENENTTRGSSTRLRRTQEWILHQQSSQSSSSEQIAQEDSKSKLEQCVTSQVHNFIEEAARLIEEESNRAAGGSLEAVSSASLIFLHRREPEFTFDTSTTNSVFATPSDNDLRLRVFANARHHLDSSIVYQPENCSFGNTMEVGNHNEVVESSMFDISRISSHLTVGNDDNNNNVENESNYDPTDWEHSAPSSAIDDQDIIMRFAELQDDEGEADNGHVSLNEQDCRGISKIISSA